MICLAMADAKLQPMLVAAGASSGADAGSDGNNTRGGAGAASQTTKPILFVIGVRRWSRMMPMANDGPHSLTTWRHRAAVHLHD